MIILIKKMYVCRVFKGTKSRLDSFVNKVHCNQLQYMCVKSDFVSDLLQFIEGLEFYNCFCGFQVVSYLQSVNGICHLGTFYKFFQELLIVCM
jgi:hypothetical protein